MDEFTIREANPDDIPGITRVLDGTLGQDFRYGERSFEENVRIYFSTVMQDENEELYVVEQEGEIVGFSYFINKPPANGTAILEMFAIRKDKQRRGIGSRLIAQTSEMFVESQKKRGINLRTLHLTTGEHNVGAQTIYSRAGYEKATEIHGFVGDKNIEYVMLKRVSEEPAPEEYRSEK